MPADIVLLSTLHALVEVAGLMLLARGALWLFGPKARKGTFVYDIFTIGATPFIKFTRTIAPRFVRDVYIPAVTFFLLFCIWVALQLAKQSMCAARGLQCV